MLFTTGLFALFLAVLVAIYYLLPYRCRPYALLIGSMGYFAVTGAANLVLILVTFGSAYGAARWMQHRLDTQRRVLQEKGSNWDKATKKAFRAKEKRKRLWILTGALVLNFSLVALLKLDLFGCGSFATSINKHFHISTDWEVLTLLGLSFYTFQTMGYLIEVYREKAPAERNPFRLLLFVSYFPLLLQGPICRYKDIYEQLFAEHPFSVDNLNAGLLRISWGLAKKLLVANRLVSAIAVIRDTPESYHGGWFLLITLLYSAKIYADFTGGIDMTIGISRLFGISLPENFLQPFFSKSTKEYWNRWHISLGEWFTDYLFYPLSVCKPMLALSTWSRAHLGKEIGKRVPVYAATITTWFVTGLWHGTAWNFIVWGLLNCLVILVSQELTPLYRKFRRALPRLTGSRFYAIFEMLRTFLLMGFIRILDVYGRVGLTFRLFFGMFFPAQWKGTPTFSAFLPEVKLATSDLAVLAGSIVVMIAVSAIGYEKTPIRKRLENKPVMMLILTMVLFTVSLLLGRYGIGYDPNAFRYA